MTLTFWKIQTNHRSYTSMGQSSFYGAVEFLLFPTGIPPLKTTIRCMVWPGEFWQSVHEQNVHLSYVLGLC